MRLEVQLKNCGTSSVWSIVFVQAKIANLFPLNHNTFLPGLQSDTQVAHQVTLDALGSSTQKLRNFISLVNCFCPSQDRQSFPIKPQYFFTRAPVGHTGSTSSYT